ncbi:MAG: GerMN domain-containing protein [Christensenella sp.]
MKKQIVVFFLVIALLFSGCAIVQEDTKQHITYIIDETAMQEVNLEAGITINPTLYFLDKSKTELAAEARTLLVGQDERAEAKIVETIIAGPASDNLEPVAEGFVYDQIEILPDLINVFVTADKAKTNIEIDLMKLAVAATLIDYAGISYVNVFVNGMQVGYNGHPVGALQKSKGSLREEETKLQNAAADSPSLDVILYFLDNTERFLVPEARSFQFESNVPEEMIAAVVRRMIRGPENTYQHMPIIDKSIVELLSAQIIEDDTGQRIVRLDFNKAPVAVTKQFSDGEKIAALAIAKTLVGFMPNISGVEIYVNGAPQAEPIIYTQQMSSDLLGNSVQLYFPNAKYTLLTGVERMVSYKTAGYAIELLAELMRGPTSSDDKDVSPAFGAGISIEDVNDVYLAGNTAVVDFKGSMREKMKSVNKTDEAMMIYSIVNTLTNMENVKRVQFLIDGERVESLGGGIINIIDPLIKNSGIIRNE